VIKIACSALLFDLDGVLIDSTPAVERVWRQWAVERGFDPEEAIHRAHGRPSISTIREYLPDADHEAENREVERREIEDLEGVVALRGSRELLSALPPERWAIVTSCTRPLATVRIRAGGLPEAKYIVTSNDIKHGKPAPDPYLKGAASLGFPATECVVFEDVPAGIRSGKAAGARVIALQTTMTAAALKEAGADWVVENCGAIQLSRDKDNLVLTFEQVAT
jgi:mannitol-1-/sugar-/sorbitol-6-phosphatase